MEFTPALPAIRILLQFSSTIKAITAVGWGGVGWGGEATLAAPVALGMIFWAAPRPPRQSFLEGPSTVF